MNTLGHTLYLRMTDKEGLVTLSQHQVWDAERFMKARAKDAADLGGKAKAEQITEQDYRKASAK